MYRKRNVLRCDDDDDELLCVSPRSDKELVVSYPDLLSTNFQRQLLEINLRWLNKVLVVCEYMSFAKFWQVKNILMKNFD